MIIDYKEERLMGLPLLKEYTDEEKAKMTDSEKQTSLHPYKTLQIYPGINHVSEEDWKAARLHVKHLIKAGLLVMVEATSQTAPGKKGEIVKTPWQLTPQKAKAFLKDIVSPDTLREWDANEVRPEIRVLITKRMEELEVLPNEEDAETRSSLTITTDEEV